MTDPEIANLARRVSRLEAALAQPILPPIVAPEPPDPEPDPQPQPEPSFRALSYIYNSADQNKLVRLPALRESRTPRRSVAAIGDVKDWTETDGPGSPLLKCDLESTVPQGYQQWSSNLHRNGGEVLQQRPGAYCWRNIGVSPAKGADQLKWGTREFNAPRRSFVNCDFTDIPKEHGIYVSNYDGTSLIGCTFQRIGSQGAQFAHRPLPYAQYPPDNRPYEKSPRHLVEDCHFVDCGNGGTRPSFNLTYFNPGTSEHPGHLEVRDSSFVADLLYEPRFYNGREIRSTGAMVVAEQQGNLPLSERPMMKTVWLRNNLYDFTMPDRAIVELRSCESIVIEDCAFLARDSSYPLVMIDQYMEDSPIDVRTHTITLRRVHAQGGRGLRIKMHDGTVEAFDMHCPEEEIIINARHGRLVSRTFFS